VRAWVEAQNLALSTGDTSELRELAAPDCRGCSDYSEGIDRIVDAGGHFEGGQWRVVRLQAETSAKPLRINAAIHIAGGTTVTASGAQPNHYEATNRLLVFELTDESGAWLVSLIGSLS
jgi:Family of unknown function (DUF6318)